MTQDRPKDERERDEAPQDEQDTSIPLEEHDDSPPPGKPHIDSPTLLDGFDEDADFDADPEVERVVKGIPVGHADKPKAHPTARATDEEPGDPLSPSPSWRIPAIIGGLIALTAAILAGVYADNTQWAHVLITIYWAALHTATGVGAVVLSAVLLGRPLGSLEGAAARMLLTVSLFLVVFSLEIPISGTRIEETALAAAAYFGGLVVAFRLAPRDAAVVAGAHFGIALLVTFGSMLSTIISSGAAG